MPRIFGPKKFSSSLRKILEGNNFCGPQKDLATLKPRGNIGGWGREEGIKSKRFISLIWSSFNLYIKSSEKFVSGGVVEVNFNVET